MSLEVALPLDAPASDAAGSLNGVWITDPAATRVVRVDPVSGEMLSEIDLDGRPTSLEVAAEQLWVALADGAIMAFALDTEELTERRSAGTGPLRLESDGGRRLWIMDEGSETLTCLEAGSVVARVGAPDASDFAPASDGRVFWLGDGDLRFSDGSGPVATRVDLPVPAASCGALAVCANALWVSVPLGLMILPLRSVSPGPVLPAPEGPVPCLQCHAHRLFGGRRGVFLLDPAADDDIRSLDVHAQSDLAALAFAGDRLWAVESARPVAHVLRVV